MKFLKILLKIVLSLIIIVIGVVVIRAWESRSMPDLKYWHTSSIDKEPLMVNEYEDIASYLKDEDQYIRKMFAKMADSAYGKYNRFNPLSPSYPFQHGDNLNASFVYDPGAENTKGVILLIHGLTDSPYHMRAIGSFLKDEGFYVLCLRLPGHGTLPAGLLDIRWQDWAKATKWGADQLHKLAAERGNIPFYMGGFSTGGALILNYSLNALADDKYFMPEKLFLFSPAIGVSELAMVSSWHKSLSWIPYFKKFSWLDILPEYDPAKYNSFTKNAGRQVYLLTLENKDLIKYIVGSESLKNNFPSVIAFQSLVDATVITKDLLEMYKTIGTPNDELFLFDVNHLYKDFMSEDVLNADVVSQDFIANSEVGLHIITNLLPSDTTPLSPICAVYDLKDNSRTDVYPDQHTPWPDEHFAMSHIGVPIAPDDSYYGSSSILGSVAIHGEKEVLFISSDDFMRLRYNPFFELMKMEMRDFIRK